MAWDIQIDGGTGDLVFSPAHDIAGVSGEGLLRQRVSMRCKVPRGTYLYDTDGDFGSNLHLVPRAPSPAQIAAAKTAVTEALEPMRDEISIQDVSFDYTPRNQLQVNVLFSATTTDPDVPTIDASDESDPDLVSVTISQDF